MTLLKTDYLEKTYGKGSVAVKALKSTYLTIEKGEFAAVIGPSGSGKSTLLHLLAGLDKPTEGHVYINDVDIHAMDENKLAKFRRRNIGFIFQFFNLVPVLTVEENIKLPMIMDKGVVDEKYIDELMNTLGIKDRRKHFPGQISGGQQQRVAIARALASKPSIIFADEPTGNLDSKNSREVLGLLTKSIKKYNQTLVMITHDTEVAKHADRIIKIEDGSITEDSSITKEGENVVKGEKVIL